jgi:hypothetical protein
MTDLRMKRGGLVKSLPFSFQLLRAKGHLRSLLAAKRLKNLEGD